MAEDAGAVLTRYIYCLKESHCLFEVGNVPIIIPEAIHIYKHDELVDMGGHACAYEVALVAKEAFQMIMLYVGQMHISCQNIETSKNREI